MLTVGELFAGIGGFGLGFERAGMRTLWQVELDPFCRSVLSERFPGAHQHADVRDCTGDPKRWAEHGGTLLEYVDVLCGGFPCQDISLAGRGGGIEGERSGLWAEYARLIRELRPRYVVVENVAALLVRGLGRVLGDLAEVGYDAEWDCIPASAVGAPHQRDRLWLVAYPRSPRRREDAAGAHGDEGADAGGRAQDDHVAGGSGPQRLPTGRRDAGDPDADSTGRSVISQHDGRPLIVGRRSSGGHADGLRHEVADTDSERRNGRAGQLRSGRRGELANGGSEPASAGTAEWWATEPDVGRVANGIPARVVRLKALGNALVPEIPFRIGRRIIEWEAAA